MKLGATLKRKIGPLPAWAWLGIVAGTVLVYRHVTGAQNASATGGGASSPDLGPAAAGFGSPTIAGDAGSGGGDASQLLQPSAQTSVDPGLLGGTGTPVVYDPYGGAYDPIATYGDPVGRPDYTPPDTPPPPSTTIPPPVVADTGTIAPISTSGKSRPRQVVNATTSKTPNSTTGQRSGRVNGKHAGTKAKPADRPAPKAAAAPATSGRHQLHKSPKVEKTRSAPAQPVNIRSIVSPTKPLGGVKGVVSSPAATGHSAPAVVVKASAPPSVMVKAPPPPPPKPKAPPPPRQGRVRAI